MLGNGAAPSRGSRGDDGPLGPLWLTRAAVVVAVVMIGWSGPKARWRVSAESQSTSFRSAIDLVTLHVTVTDNAGNYVDDLAPNEFVVLENGHPQRVSVFEKPGLPLAAAVVIDASVSVRSVFAEVQDSALSFVRALRPDDVAAVMSFGDVVRVKQTFTGDRAALETAVRRTKAAVVLRSTMPSTLRSGS